MNDEKLREELQTARARITELEQTLDTMSASRSYSDALLANADDIVFFKDLERRFVAVSQSFAALLGCDKSEIIGKRIEDLLSRELGAELKAEDERIMMSGEPIIQKIRSFQLADGVKRWLLINKSPWRDANGMLRGLYGISRNITELKETQEHVSNSVRQLRMIGDAVPFPVGVTRASDGVVLYANAALGSLVGMSVEQLVGSQAPDYFFYENPSERNVLIDKVRQDGHVEGYLSRVRGDDGVLRWALATIRPLRFDEQPSFLGVLSDITEHKEREEALERISGEKDTLLQEVNHRVGNNLASLLALVHRERRDADEACITDALDKMAATIEALSTVHKLLSDVTWSPLSLSALCTGLLDALLKSTSPTPLVVVTKSDICVDSRIAHQLALVLSELVVNTLKHTTMTEDRRIDIDLQSDGSTIFLRYKDNGSGYPDTALSGNSEGFGLGLLRGLVAHSLLGTVRFSNDDGAVASIEFKTETS